MHVLHTAALPPTMHSPPAQKHLTVTSVVPRPRPTMPIPLELQLTTLRTTILGLRTMAGRMMPPLLVKTLIPLQLLRMATLPLHLPQWRKHPSFLATEPMHRHRVGRPRLIAVSLRRRRGVEMMVRDMRRGRRVLDVGNQADSENMVGCLTQGETACFKLITDICWTHSMAHGARKYDFC